MSAMGYLLRGPGRGGKGCDAIPRTATHGAAATRSHGANAFATRWMAGASAG